MRMVPCIDAKAKNIYVLVDLFNKETAQIEIIDDGWGMTYDDLCNKYTIIGRNKRLDSKMQVKVTASEIRAYYEEALLKEPQMLINFLIREIIVFDNEIHIYFNSPLQTGPDASQGLSVCDRETTIPAHIQNSYELRRKNIRLTITI